MKGLVESIDFRDTKVQTGNKDQLKVNLLSQFVACSVANAAFMDYFAKVKFFYAVLGLQRGKFVRANKLLQI